MLLRYQLYTKSFFHTSEISKDSLESYLNKNPREITFRVAVNFFNFFSISRSPKKLQRLNKKGPMRKEMSGVCANEFLIAGLIFHCIELRKTSSKTTPSLSTLTSDWQPYGSSQNSSNFTAACTSGLPLTSALAVNQVCHAFRHCRKHILPFGGRGWLKANTNKTTDENRKMFPNILSMFPLNTALLDLTMRLIVWVV